MRKRRIERDEDVRDKGKERREMAQMKITEMSQMENLPDQHMGGLHLCMIDTSALIHLNLLKIVEAVTRDDEDDSMAKMKAAEKAPEETQKQQHSLELSGKLAAETNRVRGLILFCCYLFGRERSVADIPMDHPSCSKQHSAIQFRTMPSKLSDITNCLKRTLSSLATAARNMYFCTRTLLDGVDSALISQMGVR